MFTFDDVVDDDFCDARDREGDKLFVSPVPFGFISIGLNHHDEKNGICFISVFTIYCSAHFFYYLNQSLEIFKIF